MIDDRLQLALAGWRIWRANRDPVGQVRERRIKRLIRFARSWSPFYAGLYRALAESPDLRSLPIVTKEELTERFEDWVTDRSITKAGVEAFIREPTLVGQLFMDRYAVFTSSGVTGTPGLFLHDQAALAVYRALALVRGWFPWTGPTGMAHALAGVRVAVVVATGGHYAGAGLMELCRSLHPWLAERSKVFSVQAPLPALVRELNAFQPTVLIGYPTALALLARSAVGRALTIQPFLVVTGGEMLTASIRTLIQTGFRCQVRNAFGASEFVPLAFECTHGWLHVNEDWLVLEPFDAECRPVRAGRPSRTCLLTNLANRVQPIIRYDLGDSVTVQPGNCECGSPFQAIRVEGRSDDILYLRQDSGGVIPIPPLAVGAIAEGTRGVAIFQIIQTAPNGIQISFEAAPQVDEAAVWQELTRRLLAFFGHRGLESVAITRAPGSPRRDPATEKFRQIYSALTREPETGSVASALPASARTRSSHQRA